LKASPKFALALAFVFMVVSAGVAFLFVFLGKVYAADIYAGSAARQGSANQENAIVKMGRAIQFNSQESRYFSQAGNYYMMMANVEAMKGEKDRDIQKIQQYLNYSISAMRQSGDMSKNDISSVEALAQIYENAGLYVADSLDLASQSYRRGLELEPHNPNFYERLGQIKVSMVAVKKDEGERKQLVSDARDLFQRSVDEKNNFDKGYYQLSLAKQSLGDMDGAIESGRAAVQIDPKNPDYLISLGRMYQLRGSDDDMKISEQIFKAIISSNDNDINGHFYLGILYEKMKRRPDAKEQYKKVITLLTGDNVADTKKQLEKMISNVDQGIENTPQNLGLTTEAGAASDSAVDAGQSGSSDGQ
jgi:tetratricopeptide (TPR) repeat protein